MKRNIAVIDKYKYLIDHYDADDDLQDNQYYAEFVMLRNFTIINTLIYDNDIYIIEKSHFKEYLNEIKKSGLTIGTSIAFPIAKSKINNYSNSYMKFNDNYNEYSLDTSNTDVSDVYDIYEIKNNKLKCKKIKCNKYRIYHPIVKKNLDAIIDIGNYINGIHFHYLCRPINNYTTNSETEIKYENESYSEFIEVYYPNINDLFKVNADGTYDTFYKEDYNIVASTRNEKFINSILSSSSELEHSEMIGDAQIVPMNLLIQPYRIIEEYAAESEFNYDNNLANDEKIFVKLYLKSPTDVNSKYVVNSVTLRIYPYLYADDTTNIYIANADLPPISVTSNSAFKFSLMSRLGFSDGIISVVSMFNYPNKSYFYNMYKDDTTTSPIKEAYKYYNNVDDNNYTMFVNEEIEQELADIDAIEVLTDEMRQTTKEVANANYVDDNELLKVWKDIMKETIINEYEEEFHTPGNFLGFRIEIATDIYFKHIIYDKNYRVNFNDIDDFAFKLNGIFERWENKPEKLLVRCAFYDKIIGTEIRSNIIIITKEWFKYLINNPNVYRLSDLSTINKEKGKLPDDMKTINLNTKEQNLEAIRNLLANYFDDKDIADKEQIINDLVDNFENESDMNSLLNNVNFINTVKCIVNKKDAATNVSPFNKDQRIIIKPVFYKVNDLQNISIRNGVSQNIGINLADYMVKVETFKIIIGGKELIEYGRNDIFVIFNIDANDIEGDSGSYNITNEDGEYISSGKWTKY